MRPGFGLLLFSLALVIDMSLPVALAFLAFIITCSHSEFLPVFLILTVPRITVKTAPFLCAGIASLLYHAL